ncbi:hypothetical protein B0H13DRAFT_1867848 [Mycena leptocephala]|nr:hypothetical protein B0H13DRAFT_1867848 [Mycena leptocephala]
MNFHSFDLVFLSPRAQPNVPDVPNVASSTRPSARAAQSQDVDLIFRGPTSKALFGKSPARKSTNAYLMRHAVKDAFLHGFDPESNGSLSKCDPEKHEWSGEAVRVECTLCPVNFWSSTAWKKASTR